MRLMITAIRVVPREFILPEIHDNPNKENICVISITSPFGDVENFSEMLRDYVFTDWDTKTFDFDNQVIHLEFDDIDHNPHGYYMPMHFRQAVYCWQFAKMWHDNYKQDEEHTLYIHCDAGISRSGAVGRAISEKWGIPLTSIRRLQPNRTCLREMEIAYRYLEEGLSPKQQREVDQRKLEEIFPPEEPILSKEKLAEINKMFTPD